MGALNARMIDSTARAYEKRAANTKNPRKAEELYEKARLERRKAAGHRDGSTDITEPIQIPAQKSGPLKALPPRTGASLPRTFRSITGAVIAVCIAGVFLLSLLSEPKDGARTVEAASPGTGTTVTNDDAQSCAAATRTMRSWGQSAQDLGSGTTYTELRQESDSAREELSDAAQQASAPDVKAALRDGARFFGDSADALADMDLAATQRLGDQVGPVTERIVRACRPV